MNKTKASKKVVSFEASRNNDLYEGTDPDDPFSQHSKILISFVFPMRKRRQVNGTPPVGFLSHKVNNT